MSLQGRAQKYASNRKQELQLKRELEAVKNKALLEHYAKQHGVSNPLPPVSPPGKATIHPRSHTYAPKSPSWTQPKYPTATTKTRRVHPISSQQPEALEPSSKSLNPVKSSLKSSSTRKSDLKVGDVGQAGQKQPASQKVTVDTSQKVKFAIVNSQNTSLRMNFSHRQPGRLIEKEASSLAPIGKRDGLKASLLRQEQQVNVVSTEESESRPFSSHPTVTDSHLSASSYQRYIMSEATDYRNVDSNLTTKTANTPAPIIIEQGVSVSVSGIEDSFQPSRVDFSGKSYESFPVSETSEGSGTHSQSINQLGEQTDDTESYSRLDSSGFSMTEDQLDSAQGEMVSKPQSGRVTIEVDMRFPSMDRPGSELSQLSSGGDGLSMSLVSEQSHTASSGKGGSQHHTLPLEIGNGVDVGTVENDKGSQLECTSALSIGTSEARSSYQESEGGHYREEGEMMDTMELQTFGLALQHQYEHDLQTYSGSVSKRSSSSCQSEAESHPRSEHLSIQSNRIDPMEYERLNVEQQSFNKESETVASLEHLDEAAPAINSVDKPEYTAISDIKLPDNFTTLQQASATLDSDNRLSKSSSTLHASSSDHILSSPYSHSLSSIGMPYSQAAGTTTMSTESSQQQYSTPSQSAATSQIQSQRSSFGSVQSSVHSIKPSATHMIEGLQHLSTSGSRADTSSWLLAHHSISKIRSEHSADEGNDREPVDSEESYANASVNDIKSEIDIDDSKSQFSEHESQSQSQIQTMDSRRSSSSIQLTSTNNAQETELPVLETPTNMLSHEGRISLPTIRVEPPDIKADMCSKSHEFVLSERIYSTADISGTRVGNAESDMVGTGNEGNSRDGSDSASLNLAEYLAFSSEPVTLEDIMHVSGQAVHIPKQAQSHPKSPRKQLEEKSPKSDKPNVRFLSTWESSKVGPQSTQRHHSIHHFCMEPSLPQLPIQLQIASRKSHTKPAEGEGLISGKTESATTYISEENSRDLSSAKVCPPPNTPYTMNRTRGKAPIINQDNKKYAKKVTSMPSERPQTVDQSFQISRADDDIIERAKTELKKEQRREAKPSSAKLKENRVKRKTTPLVHNVEVNEGETMMLGGLRMKVAQDPANLLWVPAPPKLSLHPTTVQTHLFPDYHSSSTSTRPVADTTLQLWTGPSWQLTAMGKGMGRMKEQGDSSDGYPKKLLPLAFSSIKDMSLLKNPTTTLQQDTATTSTKTDSLQPSTIGSPIFELRTPTSPTGSTLSSGEKESTGSSQKEATLVQITDAKKAALARRRYSVFIGHDTKDKDIMQHVQQAEEDDEFQNIKIRAKKSSDSIKQTQSLPLISTDSADTAKQSCSDKNQDDPAISGGSVNKSEEYKQIMEEMKNQREQLLAFYNRQCEEELLAEELEQAKMDEDDGNDAEELQPMEGSMLATSGAFTSRKLQRQAMRAGRRVGGGTGGGARNTTGRVRALRRTRSAQIRVQQAREMLSQPPRSLTRTTSYPLLKDELLINTVKQPSNDYRRSKRKSLPSLLTEAHFQSLKHHIDSTNPLPASLSSRTQSSATSTAKTANGTVKASTAGEATSYEWSLRLWWDRWFPEVLQEYKQIVAAYSTIKTLNFDHRKQRGATYNLRPKEKRDKLKAEKDASTETESESAPPQLVRLANIDPPPALSSEQVQQIETEITNLTKSMSSCCDDGMRAVFLCRRGALLRKIGRLQDSLSDLRTSLSLQPSLSDALWHRHLLHLIQGDEKLALDNLNSLLKSNKKHYGAYRSRAGLILRQGDTSKAVFNLSKAIALQSNDPEMYIMRAELYEKRGEVESALTDYARVNELQPTNMEVISRQAMHKFNKGMWAASTQHYNTLLQLDPNNTQARIHRARAQYSLGRYVEALQDVSASIHLNPSGPQAFYHRACLLRTSQPQQALRDFSVSLLLDDSVANVSAYVHRGILYTQMKCYNEALSDFEAAMKLQRSLPSPHISAGLIHMLHKGNLPRAVRCFTTAIGVDPTCTRAYLCRAEAYKRSEMYDHAILDCTRVIHLEPNNPTHYLRKGKLYLSLKNFKMAALQIRTAAKLCHSGFNQSKTQQVLVESFLGNHTEAVALLKTLLRSPAVFSLMGKIQHKAKLYEEAVGSFRQAIALVERSLQPKYMVAHMSELDMTSSAVTQKVRGDIHYQCGRSLVEGGALEDAIDEFCEVIKHCPNNAMGYYERGVAKLKAGNNKGIHDLNKSLAIDPNLFQAFLARAAHYGRTGRHSKAILNCNEAIRLVPNSVRAYVYRGSLKYLVKLYPGAIDDLNTAISLDPSHAALAFFNRALCYHAIGRPQQALSDYSTVLLLLHESAGYSYKVYVNRGLLYLQLKDYTNALLDFMEAEKVWATRSCNDRGNPAIHQAIGYCHHQLCSLEAAIDAYTLAIAEDPSFLEAYVGRGNVYMDFLTEEGFSLSKADYLHVLELNNSYLPARVNLAFLLQAEGRFKQAWDELTCVLKEDSNYAPALEARAVISLQMGNTFGALLDVNNALKVVQSAALLTNRGVIHQFMGDLVNAMKDYQKAVSIQPDYSLAHFNIGNILFQQRHFKQAVTSYTRALSSSQDDSVLVNRAIAHSILHNTKQALVDFDLAIELNPHSAPSYFNRGNLHYSLGNYSSAEQDYKKALELHPDDWLTMYYYGEVLGKQRRLEETGHMFRLAARTEIL